MQNQDNNNISAKANRIQSVNKAFMLLDCLLKEDRAMSLGELSKRTGIAKSTIHAFLATMVDQNVLEQDSNDGKYRLGYHLFEYGCSVSHNWNIVKQGKSHLRELLYATGESVFLAQIYGDELLVIDSVEPNSVFRVSTRMGEHLPFHCTSQGKVILANMKNEDAVLLLKRKGMPSYTALSYKEPELLLNELVRVRKVGYATEFEEYYNGLCSIAAPIYTEDGKCIYAIGLVSLMTSKYHSKQFPAETVKALLNTAEAISTNMGWIRPKK